MKALSLIQPWATLLLSGQKTFETRSWQTDHRGWILICSSKQWNNGYEMIASQEPFKQALIQCGFDDPKELPRGFILGAALLAKIHKVGAVRLTKKEQAFGDFSDRRFAWEFTHRITLDTPAPVHGRLGLFNVPKEDTPKLFEHLEFAEQ